MHCTILYSTVLHFINRMYCTTTASYFQYVVSTQDMDLNGREGIGYPPYRTVSHQLIPSNLHPHPQLQPHLSRTCVHMLTKEGSSPQGPFASKKSHLPVRTFSAGKERLAAVLCWFGSATMYVPGFKKGAVRCVQVQKCTAQ